jgi:hypothetical protein
MNRKFSSRIAVIDLVTGRTAVQSLPESQLTVTLASCRPKYHPGDTLILSDQFHGMRKRKLYNLGDNFLDCKPHHPLVYLSKKRASDASKVSLTRTSCFFLV